MTLQHNSICPKTLFAAFVANLLSFGCGWAYAWSSPAIPKLNSKSGFDSPLSKPTTLLEESWIASLISLGAMTGPLISGPLSSKIGRKKTLLLFAVPQTIAEVIFVFASEVYHFYIGRILSGAGAGCVYTIMPIYIAEIAEVHSRGRLGCTLGASTSIGAFCCFLSGRFLNITEMSYVNLCPNIFFIIVFGLWIPESPYYCILKNDLVAAEKALTFLRGRSVPEELTDMINTVKNSHVGKGDLIALFKSKVGRKALFICLTLMFLQQFSGASATIGYLETILISAGSTLPTDLSVAAIGLCQFFSVLITSSLIDRVGRKLMLMASATICFVSLASLGFYFYLAERFYNVESLAWLPFVSFLGYFVGFAFGMGPVIWGLMGELFPPHLKSAGSTLTTLFCLILAFGTTALFPSISVLLGFSGGLWIFSTAGFLCIIFAYWAVPETKGKTFEQIAAVLLRN